MGKKSGNKKSVDSKKSAPVVEEVVVEKKVAEPVVEVVEASKVETVSVTQEDDNSLDTFFQQVRERLSSVEKECREMRSFVKRAELTYRRNQKLTQQQLRSTQRRRRVPRDPNSAKRAPSGIAKPAKISNELAKFLNVDPSTFMARTEVIKKIAQYIKEHKLENPDNRRQINPDKPLAKLLGSSKSDTVTYFNLQRFMKKHFPKQEAEATETA